MTSFNGASTPHNPQFSVKKFLCVHGAERESVKAATRLVTDSFDHSESINGSLFSVMINDECWYLWAGSSGPELWRGLSVFAAPQRIVRLGLFQVIVKVDVEYYLSEYGDAGVLKLDGYKLTDLDNLSTQFGIPVFAGSVPSDQRDISERAFLKSPAFAFLRRKIRSGKHCVKRSEWDYGLSTCWNVLVMLPDECFDRYKFEVVDALFSEPVQYAAKEGGGWKALCDQIHESWGRYHADELLVQAAVARILPTDLAERIGMTN